VKEQPAVWPAAEPVAVQPTVVVPTGNAEPDAGVQAVWTGGVPPVAVGAAHETVAGWPWNDTAVWGAGQASVSWGGGGVGFVGEPQPATAMATASDRLQRRPFRRKYIPAMIAQRFSARQ